MRVRGLLLCVLALGGAAAPAPALAGWTRLGELPSLAGETRAGVVAFPGPGAPTVLELLVGQSSLRLRAGRLNALGALDPLGTETVLTGRPAANTDLVAAPALTGTVAAWAEQDADGTHEHLRVVRVDPAGTPQDLGAIVDPGSERDVQPLSLAVSPSGVIAVAYLARLASGERHVRVALQAAAGIWQIATPGPFLTGAGGEPADSAVLAFEGEALDAAAGAGTPSTVLLERRSGPAWTPVGRLGPPLEPAALIPSTDGARVLASGPFGVVSELFGAAGAAPVETLPASGFTPQLNAVSAGPCALLSGSPTIIGAAPTIRVSCLGTVWSPLGPTVPSASGATSAVTLAVGDHGAYAFTETADASGPHVASYRLDADVASTAAVTGVTTASLLASVDPQGRATTAWFEYGPTTAYAASTPHTRLEVLERPLPLSAQLTGLRPGTTYHYRVVADNGAGPVGFGDQTFTVGRDNVPPEFVLSLPGRLHPGKRFTVRLRGSEAGTLRLQLVDGQLRRLRGWTLKLPPPSPQQSTRHFLLPRLKKLVPGRYLWLAQATDSAGNTTNAAPRVVRVLRR